jgi:hypothetical protein
MHLLRKKRCQWASLTKAVHAAVRLVNFHDAGRLYDGRFLLAFGKPLGAIAINVHAGKLLTVVVIHGDLPVTMFASSVPVEPAGTFCFCLCLLHDGMALDIRDYRKFDLGAQVAKRRLTFLLFSNCNYYLASIHARRQN